MTALDGGNPSPKLVSFGNPLLDIIVEEQWASKLTEKHKFQKNIAQEVDTIAEGIYEEVVKIPGTLLCGGGCALNTVRVYQWLAQKPHQAAVLGGVGADQGGKILQKFLANAGVYSRLAEQVNHPTGHCIALVQGAERTLVANLGAANHYGLDDLNVDNIKLIQRSQVIYVEGYFLIHSPEVTFKLAEFARTHKKKFVFNLCGEYVCEQENFVKDVVELLPSIDYLFGNRSEFSVFLRTAQRINISSSILQRLIQVQGREKTPVDDDILQPANCLTAVVTEGSESVTLHFISESDVSSYSFPVLPAPQDEIKDTIAAGDSFIAGFVYTLINQGSLHQCVENAIWTAQKMIRQSGASLPSTKPNLPHQPSQPFTVNKSIKNMQTNEDDLNIIDDAFSCTKTGLEDKQSSLEQLKLTS